MKKGPTLVVVAALAGTSTPAIAQAQVQPETQTQAQSTEETASGREIVVTATRRTTNLQDTPLSVSALTGQELEERGLTSVANAVQLVPGVAVSNDQPGTNEFIIRGIATTPSNATLATGVTNALTSVYLGQFPITSSIQKSPDFRFVDFERVEVLRGPQGTLYGQSAMGGVVKYIPAAPTTAKFSGHVGSYLSTTEDGGTNYGFEGHLNVPLSSTLAVRAAGYTYQNDGFIDVVGSSQIPNANDENTVGGRIALRWTPSDRLQVDLLGLYNKVDLGSFQYISSTYPVDFNLFTPPTVTPVSTKRRVTEHRQPSNEDAYLAGADILYHFDGFDANLIVARKGVDSDSLFESIEFFPLGGLVPEAYFNPRTIAESDTNTAEFRIATTGDHRLIDLIAGAYYERTKGTTGQLSQVSGDPILLSLFGLAPGVAAQDFGRSLSFREISFFGEVKLNLTDALSVSVGARHADVKNNYEFIYARGVLDTQAVGVPQLSSEKVDTYRFAADFKVTDDILLYASAASGYRPGGFNIGRPAGPLVPAVANTTFSSDDLWNYELGARTAWFDNRLTLNGAVYQIDWSDLQILTIDPTFYVATRNVGKARIRGVELESRLRVAHGFSLAANYAYTDAQLRGAPVSIGLSVLQPGFRLPATPKHAYSILADWREQVGDSELYINATYRHVGERVADISNQALTMPSYNNLDLRLGTRLASGLDIAFFADNVTDKVAVNQVVPTAVPNFTYLVINRPRTIGIVAKYSF